MHHPASAKFALQRRIYNLVNLLIRSKKVKCDVCGWEGYRFNAGAGETYIRYNAVCPSCGCLDRQRALINYMNQRGDFRETGLKCLDIAPVSGFRDYFETRGWDYISIDLNSDLAMIRMDVQRLEFSDNTFDLIICSHVLEHVKDDTQAIKELFRVLVNGGNAYVIIPLNTHLQNTIEFDKPHAGHVRDYGADAANRFKAIGFKVEVVDLAAVEKWELCLLCGK